MFTGIIQGLGTVQASRPAGGGRILTIAADFDLDDPVEGESIACNGACLTARDIRGRSFLADVSPESLARTNLGQLRTGSRVNLERALRLSDRLGGHMVSGHVDCLGTVRERRAVGDFTLFAFSLPPEWTRYVIEKGSIAVNGVSLTVNSCDGGGFSLSVIPHTLGATTLETLKQGDGVNIEVDIIGKYVEKLLSPRGDDGIQPRGISASFLAEHGFLRE